MRKSLRAQLIIAIILLAVVPLLLVGVDTLRRTYNVEQQQAVALQQEIVRRVTTELETYIFSREEDLRLLVDVQGLPDLEIEQQKALLRSLSYGQDVYAELVLIDSQGQTIAFESPVSLSVEGEAQSYAGTSIFTIPRDSRETYYSSVQIDEETGEPFMTIAVPFYDLQTGNFGGVLAANFLFRPMWTLMEEISSEIHGLVYVVDSNNHVVAHPDRSVVLQRTTATIPTADGFAAGLAGEDAVLAHQFISLSPTSSAEAQGLHVVAEVPEGEALELANNTLIVTIVALVVAIFVAGGIGTQVALRITRPIGELATTAQAISAGDFSRQVTVNRKDEIGTLGTAFNSMTTQLRNSITELEQRVAARTRDLNLAAEIGRQVSQVRDLHELLPHAVQLVLEQFDLYQTQIYLVNETGEQLVLEASTGHAGTQLLEAGHKLPLDETSLNGTAATTKQAVIVADTAENPSFHPNPLLPDTRSEMVVPLLVGEKVVGVLDLQSDKPNVLTEDNLSAFETLSGQLAVAIQNAALLAERRQAEAQIQERESLMRTIIDATPDWIFIKDKAHRYQLVNRGYANALHIASEDFIGKNDLELGFPEELVKGDPEKGIRGFWADDRLVMESGQMQVYPDDPATIDGEVHTFHTIKTPLKDDDGQAWGVLAFARDITESKRIEEVVRRSEADLSQTLKIAKLAYWEFDVEKDLFTFNDQFYSLFHTTAEAHGGYRLPSAYYAEHFVYPDDLPIVGAEIERALNSTDRHYSKSVEHRILYADGGVGYISVNINIDRDEQGNILRYYGANQDITERKQVEETIAKRAVELETVANVSAVVTTALEPEELMQQVVDLTKERFNLYHAHIYLLNENKTDLVLTSGAGEIGATMVAEGRRIALSQEQSLVARAARKQAGVVINNVQEEPGFLPNPLLPETRAEMAVPLVAGNEVLGVLDVQADEVDRFTSEDINIFSTLASQIAVALQNARRHNEALRTLDELTRLQRIMVREGWEDYMATQERPSFGYAFNPKGAKPIEDTKKEAVVAKEIENGTEEPIVETAVPIAVRGELIGKIALRNPDGSPIPERKQSLIQTVAHQVSEALERARLTEQTQRALQETNEQARRLALLNELSETISRMTTVEEIASAVMNKASEILEAKHHSLYLIAEENEMMLRVVGEAGEVADRRKGELMPLAESPMAQALEERQIVTDLSTNGEDALQVYHVPLYTGEGPLGTFNIAVAANAALDEGEQLILLQIGSLLSTTLENRRLFTQTDQRAAELSLINRVSEVASSQLNMAELFNSVGALIQETFMASSVYFGLYDKQESIISFPYFYTEEDGFFDVEPGTLEDGGFAAKIIETRKSLCLLLHQDDSDSEVTAEDAIIEGHGRLLDSFVGVPMIVGREVVGVIGLSNYSEIRTYTEQDQRLLETLAATIGVAVQNSQQFEAAQRRAERESLINTINQKIQSATTVEGALQTAVSELSQALRVKKAIIELSTSEQSNGHT